MGFTLGRFDFLGPFSSIDEIEDREGVVAVICQQEDHKNQVIHVAEGAHIRSVIRNHTMTNEWARRCPGRIVFGVNYTTHLQKPGRKVIVDEIVRTNNLKS